MIGLDGQVTGHRYSRDVVMLRQDRISVVSLFALTASVIAWTLGLPEPRFRWEYSLVFTGLALAAYGAYAAREEHPWLSEIILLLGPVLSLALSLRTMNDPVIPYCAMLIVIANAMIRPSSGVAATILATTSLMLCLPMGRQLYSALVLTWLTMMLEWISARGLHTALDWAWNSQRHANRLLAELRVRQGELKRTLEALNEATRRLQQNGYVLTEALLRAEEAREMKQRFAANISHELRTPLNLILGFSEMMHLSRESYGDMVWPAVLRRDVRRVYEASRQLLSLLNDVLDLSRPDATEMTVHREPADLGSVIEEAVSTASDLFRSNSLTLRSQLPENLPIIHFDRTRIRQVLLNLLSNAASFTERGSITVAAEVNARDVVVSVTDTGIGIPPDELGKVFDEFHQVNMSLYRRQGRAGLGLSISKRFVELHGGWIWAESKPGKGSTFRFALPTAESGVSVSRITHGRPIQSHSNRRKRCIVVIDGDSRLTSILKRQLADYDVLHASTQERAVVLVAHHAPIAVLWNAPPDTLAASVPRCEALGQLLDEVPVLVCSVPNQAVLARHAHVAGLVHKPVIREELFESMGSLGPDVQDILVVDDDQGFVQLLVRFLENAGRQYRIRWAYDGREALAMVEAKPPDAILLDLDMSRMDGLGLLSVLRQDARTKDIPVVAIIAADSILEQHVQSPGGISLVRRQALSTGETIRYLQAMLSVTNPISLPKMVLGHPAVAAD